jgi:hypothetical protein
MYLVRPDLHVGAALASLHQGRLQEARDHARAARDFAESRAMLAHYPFLDLADGYTRAAAGDPDAAIGFFRDAVEGAERLDYRPTTWTAAAEAADLLDRAGDADAAAAMRRRGRRAVDEIAGFFTDVRMRDEYVQRATARLAGP